MRGLSFRLGVFRELSACAITLRGGLPMIRPLLPLALYAEVARYMVVRKLARMGPQDGRENETGSGESLNQTRRWLGSTSCGFDLHQGTLPIIDFRLFT